MPAKRSINLKEGLTGAFNPGTSPRRRSTASPEGVSEPEINRRTLVTSISRTRAIPESSKADMKARLLKGGGFDMEVIAPNKVNV
jgi:hypothetical protein